MLLRVAIINSSQYKNVSHSLSVLSISLSILLLMEVWIPSNLVILQILILFWYFFWCVYTHISLDYDSRSGIRPRVIRRFLKKSTKILWTEPHRIRQIWLGSHLPFRWLEILVQMPVFPHWQVDFPGCSCKGTLLTHLPLSFPCRATSRRCQHTPSPKSLLPLCLQLSHQASVLSTAQLLSLSPATFLLGA